MQQYLWLQELIEVKVISQEEKTMARLIQITISMIRSLSFPKLISEKMN